MMSTFSKHARSFSKTKVHPDEPFSNPVRDPFFGTLQGSGKPSLQVWRGGGLSTPHLAYKGTSRQTSTPEMGEILAFVSGVLGPRVYQ